MILKAQSIYGSEHRMMEIQDGRIVRLFTDKSARADHVCGGHIYPAFTDTHMHLIGYGMLQTELSLADAVDIADAMKKLADYLPTCGRPVVTGRNWNQDLLADRRLLRRSDIDPVAPHRPVVLRRVCGHIASLNTAALIHYGILCPDGTPCRAILDRYPDEIDCGEYGLPTGVLREKALELLSVRYTDEELTDFMQTAQERLLAYGIAAVHTDDLYFRENPEEVREFFERMVREKRLKVRVYQQSQFGNLKSIRAALDRGYRQDRSGSLALFKNGPFKILADGSLGGRTAFLKKPYLDDPTTRGLLIYPADELKEMIALAAAHDVETVIHAIGDATVQIILDQHEKIRAADSGRKTGPNARRDAIVHCQIMSVEQIRQMGRIGLHALVQPVFLGYDSKIVKDRVGEQLARSSYAYRSMRESGIRLGFGSDAPVEDPNPLSSLYHAVEAPLYPEEAITTDEAIAAFTSDAAFFAYEESVRGKLAPGFAADLCVLERRIAPPILDNRVLETYVGGELRYCL